VEKIGHVGCVTGRQKWFGSWKLDGCQPKMSWFAWYKAWYRKAGDRGLVQSAVQTGVRARYGYGVGVYEGSVNLKLTVAVGMATPHGYGEHMGRGIAGECGCQYVMPLAGVVDTSSRDIAVTAGTSWSVRMS